MSKPWTDKEQLKDLAVVIMRVQPLHYGHIHNIEIGLKTAKTVLVLIGSAYNSRSPKNPFTYDEREKMILDYYRDSKNKDRIIVEPLGDNIYEDNQWLTEVQDIVAMYSDKDIVVIGHDKDETSYYIHNFPQWGLVETGRWPTEVKTVDATQIRELYFKHDLRFVSGVVPATVYLFLEWFSTQEAYKELVEEKNFLTSYKLAWTNAPYPPTFNTVDAIVIQSGHILLITRKANPGKGLLALPGGFVGNNETLEESVIRELREETKLKVPVPVLKGSIIKNKVFDNPYRSQRGRTITQAYLFQLKNEESLPKVKGGDDASNAKWFTLSDFYTMEDQMYEDHYYIVKSMIDNV